MKSKSKESLQYDRKDKINNSVELDSQYRKTSEYL